MIAVGAKPLLVVLAENCETGAVEDIVVISAGQCQFANRLLGKNRPYILALEYPDVAGGGDTQPISHTHGAFAGKQGNGGGKGK